MLDTVTTEDGEVVVIPDTLVVTLWRNLLSTVYMHPNLLIHPDMLAFRRIFIENNIIHENSVGDIFIPLPGLEQSAHKLRPPIPLPNTALQLIFGQVDNFDITATGITIKSYRLCNAVKEAVAELAKFIRIYPQALYGDEFGFIYDFLVRFGLPPKIIESRIRFGPQRLRRRSVLGPKQVSPKKTVRKRPTKASVLEAAPLRLNGTVEHNEPEDNSNKRILVKRKRVTATHSGGLPLKRSKITKPVEPRIPSPVQPSKSKLPSPPSPPPSPFVELSGTKIRAELANQLMDCRIVLERVCIPQPQK